MYEQLLKHARVVFCLGSGGVGKTTTSIALAFLAAQHGKRVGLLSIDPAKRLAAALGLSLQGDLKKIPLPTDAVKGEIHAAMLDQKAVFDEIVSRFTKDKKMITKIMQSPMYVSAAKGFGGAIEYMALAKLESMLESKKFDIIIVDTPPDAHALDFLSKPDILSGFIENKVMSWLIKPVLFANKLGLGKLMSMGEKLSAGIAKVTGFASLRILAEFLTLMQDVIFGLHDVGVKITHTLKQKDTAFVLISTLNHAAMRSAASMVQQLRAQNLALQSIIINRRLPKNVAAAAASKNCRPQLARRARGEQKLEETYFVQNAKAMLSDSTFLRYVDETRVDLQTIDGLTRFAATLDA